MCGDVGVSDENRLEFKICANWCVRLCAVSCAIINEATLFAILDHAI